MMSEAGENHEDALTAQALRWHAASMTDAMDWDGFTRWLEQDPRHRQAYDGVALSDALIERHAADLATPAVDQPATRTFPWRWLALGTAVAASLIGAIVALRPDSVEIYDTAGTARMIALADGSRIDLAPRSHLEVHGDNRIALRGDAVFAVRHDPARTLVVLAGPVEVSDIGTRFEVRSGKNGTRVSVAEGSVSVSIADVAAPSRLVAGQALAVDTSGEAMIAATSPGAIGSWLHGQLSYADAPLALVADDLARYAGVRVDLAPEVASMHFSGTLATGDGKAAVANLASIMGLSLHRDGDRLRIDRR